MLSVVGDVSINDAPVLRSGLAAESRIGQFLPVGTLFAILASCLAFGVRLTHAIQV
jgi:hypothetical protein